MAVSSCLAVITGIGCVTPLGLGGRELVAGMLQTNQTALRPVIGFSTLGTSRRMGAEIPAGVLPDGDETRRWGRVSTMTVTACRQAVADAAIEDPAMLAQAGLVVGSEYGDLRSTEAFALGYLRKGPTGLSPLLFPNTVMNAMAGNTSIALGLQGPMLTLNQHGVAGETAIARAAIMIRASRAPVMLACGVDELFALLYQTLSLLNVPAPQDGREERCRPFDRRHNGPILGEGATAVVLEDPAHAQARGAPVLAAIRGVAWGSQPVRPHRYPVPQQLRRDVLERTLALAAVAPHEVATAYLSGCGDPQHDEAELAALALTFAPSRPVLTSVTHLAGEYGGLGALRVAAAAMTIQCGRIPLLDYLCQPIRTDVCFATQALAHPPAYVLVHGLGRGGMQTALLLGRPQDTGTSHA